jgi:glycosyltransferase involved in cell wall biosynthesis
MSEILVITPTTGAPVLEEAIRSVANQTVKVDHLVVCDGYDFRGSTDFIVNKLCEGSGAQACYLPFNTGGGGFYGHRIMAGFSHLVNHEYILFLDQDNTFAPNHVESLVSLIKRFKYDWAYSLRTITDKAGNVICEDNCESLGRWPVWVKSDQHLVDTSSYCFTKAFLRMVGHIWDYGWGADRRFYSVVKDQIQHRNYGCTGKYTLQYRLEGNEGSVKPEFFLEGNKHTFNQYNGKYPWLDEVE